MHTLFIFSCPLRPIKFEQVAVTFMEEKWICASESVAIPPLATKTVPGEDVRCHISIVTKWSFWMFVPVLVFCFSKTFLNIPASIASARSFDEVAIDLKNEELHHFIHFHLSSGSTFIYQGKILAA